MKKITVLLASLCMLLAMLIPAYGFNNVNNGISASSSTVPAGTTFEVELKIPAISTKLATIEFNISFPNDVLEVVTYTKPAFATSFSDPADANREGRLTCTNYSASGDADLDVLKNGGTMKATFKVKANATVGSTHEIKVTKYTVDAIDEATGEGVDVAPKNIIKSVSVKVGAPLKPATGLTLNKTSLSLKTGDASTLTATIAPADSTDKVTWTSSKTSVVRVDANGKLTAVSHGTATITAKAGSKTATCTVTVACPHSKLTAVAAKDSTCLVKGWDAYNKCAACGQLVAADGKTLISAAPYRKLAAHTTDTAIWKSNSKVHWHPCKVSGCKAHLDEAAHTFTETVADDGTKTKICDVCKHKVVIKPEATTEEPTTEEPTTEEPTTEEPTTEEPTTEEPTTEEPTTKAPEAETTTTPETTTAAVEKKQNKGGNNTGLLIGIIVLIGGGAGAGAYMYNKKK